MNIKPECMVCLLNQALKVAKLLKLSDEETKKIMDETTSLLPKYDLNHTPPQIAKDEYALISSLTREGDPLKEIKEKSTQLAKSIDTSFIKTLHDAIKASVIGNVIDFGAQMQFDINLMFKEEFNKEFSVDDFKQFQNDLKNAKTMVILGDNVGEHIFDKLLMEKIKELYDIKIYYFVRGKPIINDITNEEAKILEDVAVIVDTGVATPGYELREANEYSKKIFRKADIVLSKGMGNFESLYNLTDREIYYLFVVKCEVVASAIKKNIKDTVFFKG